MAVLITSSPTTSDWIFTYLDKKTLSADASKTSSALPSGYDYYLIDAVVTLSDVETIWFQFNADAGANYNYVYATAGTLAQQLNDNMVQCGAGSSAVKQHIQIWVAGKSPSVANGVVTFAITNGKLCGVGKVNGFCGHYVAGNGVAISSFTLGVSGGKTITGSFTVYGGKLK